MPRRANLSTSLLMSVFLVVLAVSGNACAKIIYVDADVNAYNRFFTHSTTKLSEIFPDIDACKRIIAFVSVSADFMIERRGGHSIAYIISTGSTTVRSSISYVMNINNF